MYDCITVRSWQQCLLKFDVAVVGYDGEVLRGESRLPTAAMSHENTRCDAEWIK